MAKSYTLAELAAYLAAPFDGDGALSLVSVADLKDAKADQISFLSNKKFAPFLATTAAGAVIVREGDAVPEGVATIRVAEPYLAYAKLSALFVERATQPVGVHSTAVVAATAKLGEGVRIGPHCVVEDDVEIGAGTELQAQVFVGRGTRLGEKCLIYAHVTLYHKVTLGNEVTVHANTTIGSDGFGFAPTAQGWVKIHQLGGVVIGDRVEIGASTSIDRGAINDTVIARGVIIDNQVHIAHNCYIDEGTAIAGCTGIAGSTYIGKRCTIGGHVAIAGHLTIGDDVHFNGATDVTKSIQAAGVYSSGTPVQEVKSWRKNAVRVGQLNEWVERIKKLEQNDSNT